MVILNFFLKALGNIKLLVWTKVNREVMPEIYSVVNAPEITTLPISPAAETSEDLPIHWSKQALMLFESAAD